MKMEIRITKEPGDNQKSLIEDFERLAKSFFPLLVIDRLKEKRATDFCQSGWIGTLHEFVEIVELRESFGKNPNKEKMYKAFLGKSQKEVMDEVCRERECCLNAN